MLNQIQGVSGRGSSTKQGGDEQEEIKNEDYRTDNEAFGSGKDKAKETVGVENQKEAIDDPNLYWLELTFSFT
ncbi:unnamed protein product [Lactuca virosa]|uniref:Uncharacterized protein n=1 Tax=Lactuca virosa TaxID=75947 RepID=A0AAU9MJH3_9ASTR|nr:unnamed protein product [Lactuca virosa]